MEQKGRYVNIKTKEGKFILSLYFNPGSGVVLEDRLGPEPRRDRETPKGNGGNGGNGNGKGNGNGSTGNDDALMTYPQKRFLFRILAGQGIEGDKANEHLVKLFQTDSLNNVTKVEASRMIEFLLSETKGGETNG
jgi:hypothetical protein